MGTRHDLRRQERRPCEHNVTVTWHDARGDHKFAFARALDISESGIRLQMPEPPPLGLLGNASVRHCARTAASKFTVGAEFTAGLQWTPEKQN